MVTETLSPLQTAVNADSSLSIFNAAISRASETELLQKADPLTAIIPVNDAFRLAGINAAAINTMPVSTVDSMVKYFFFSSVNQPASSSDSGINTLVGLPVYGAYDGTNIYFNGAVAVPQTSVASNVVLYKINTLLLPPVYSIAQYLQADPSLTLFNEAMQRTGLINSFNSGWYTVLIPDNTAFANAGYPDIASIDNADLTTLTNIINYHIINAPYFSNNLNGTIAVSTDEGATVNVSNSGGAIQVTGNSNTSPATVTSANILLAGNVIVHKINGVLLP
jgi:uncharacterized surface protein with fasciclin (FAS1) repeats